MKSERLVIAAVFALTLFIPDFTRAGSVWDPRSEEVKRAEGLVLGIMRYAIPDIGDDDKYDSHDPPPGRIENEASKPNNLLRFLHGIHAQLIAAQNNELSEMLSRYYVEMERVRALATAIKSNPAFGVSMTAEHVQIQELQESLARVIDEHLYPLLRKVAEARAKM